MRSRYSAFAANDGGYLLRTWHSSTRPAGLDLDPQTHWRRLDILGTVRGGFLDADGVVEFRAYSRRDGVTSVLHEISSFVREDGRWVYLEAKHLELS